MGLKKSIVIVNEFTFKGNSGKGSRGSSPGSYVLRYMARDKATEDLTPVRLDTENYITRYMARKEASETLHSVAEIKDGMRKAQGYGGVAFGYGDISLSHKALKEASKDIQDNFDKGKTVMKTVISFDEDYLRENGILSPGFTFKRRGDYRGNIDQMKLRMAIMNGMDKIARDYDDLQYVGVIQVDTEHVHCHIAAVDRGKGHLTKNGLQKGKLSEKNKRDLRRGIDMFLDEKQTVRMLSSNITHDKRNALCFIKKYTHKTMDEHSMPQFLLACLPRDKRLWRASTNRSEMRKPNAIVKEFVMSVLSEPDSGYKNALRSVDEYARTRQMREDLTEKDYRQLYYNGQRRIIEDCMNAVYSVLKTIPESEYKVRTPTIDMMSMDYEEMAVKYQSDPMIEFGFRLRSYSSRLNFHKKEMQKYHDAAKSYEQAKDVSEASKPLYDFFKFEEEYNAKLMCKYQHFLSFIPPSDEYEDEFNDLMEYKHRIRNLKKLKDDKSIKRMSSENAEDYGYKVYEVHGGRYMTFAPDVIDRRISIMESDYEEKESEFRYKLMSYGLTLDDRGVSSKKFYEFDDVKALDIHHLKYDFPDDFLVSKINIDNFIEAADKRYDLFMLAKDYLEGSGQSDALRSFAVTDINVMKNVANEMRSNPVMAVVKPNVDVEYRRNGKTVRLDIDYTQDMKSVINEVIQSRQLGNE